MRVCARVRVCGVCMRSNVRCDVRTVLRCLVVFPTWILPLHPSNSANVRHVSYTHRIFGYVRANGRARVNEAVC